MARLPVRARSRGRLIKGLKIQSNGSPSVVLRPTVLASFGVLLGKFPGSPQTYLIRNCGSLGAQDSVF